MVVITETPEQKFKLNVYFFLHLETAVFQFSFNHV